jgi:maltose-binding protein MalE
MKVKPKPRQQVIQMKLTERDKQVLQKLKMKNRTLRESDIFRMALDWLAEKQGLLADLHDSSGAERSFGR